MKVKSLAVPWHSSILIFFLFCFFSTFCVTILPSFSSWGSRLPVTPMMSWWVMGPVPSRIILSSSFPSSPLRFQIIGLGIISPLPVLSPLWTPLASSFIQELTENPHDHFVKLIGSTCKSWSHACPVASRSTTHARPTRTCMHAQKTCVWVRTSALFRIVKSRS